MVAYGFDLAAAIAGEAHLYIVGMKLRLPIYLDDPLQTRLAELASAKGVELSDLVNDLLRKDLERIEMAR